MDLQAEFNKLAEKNPGKDLQANFVARSDGQEQWTIVNGDRYSREQFRRLATEAGRRLSPGSSDPVATWLRYVREQPVTNTEYRWCGTEYDAEDPENTSVRILLGAVYEVAKASELAAASDGDDTVRDAEANHPPPPNEQPKGTPALAVTLSATEAANYVGCTPKTMRAWIRDHGIDADPVDATHYKFLQHQLNTKKEAIANRKAKRS